MNNEENREINGNYDKYDTSDGKPYNSRDLSNNLEKTNDEKSIRSQKDEVYEAPNISTDAKIGAYQEEHELSRELTLEDVETQKLDTKEFEERKSYTEKPTNYSNNNSEKEVSINSRYNSGVDGNYGNIENPSEEDGEDQVVEYYVSDEQMYQLLLEENKKFTQQLNHYQAMERANSHNTSRLKMSTRSSRASFSSPSVYESMMVSNYTPYLGERPKDNPWIRSSPSARPDGLPLMTIDALGERIDEASVNLSKSTLCRYKTEFEEKEKEIEDTKQHLERICMENEKLLDRLNSIKKVIEENRERKEKIRRSVDELRVALQQGQNIYSNTYESAEKTILGYSSDLKKTSDSCRILSDKARVHKQLLKTLQDEFSGVDAARASLSQELERLKAQLSEEKTLKENMENKIRENRNKSELYGKETLKILDKMESIGVGDDVTDGQLPIQQQLAEARRVFEQRKAECEKLPRLKRELEAVNIEISSTKMELFDIKTGEQSARDNIARHIAELEKDCETKTEQIKERLNEIKRNKKG